VNLDLSMSTESLRQSIGQHSSPCPSASDSLVHA
jgi:hypothetical protein